MLSFFFLFCNKKNVRLLSGKKLHSVPLNKIFLNPKKNMLKMSK